MLRRTSSPISLQGDNILLLIIEDTLKTLTECVNNTDDPEYFSIGWLRRLHTLNVDENDLEVKQTNIENKDCVE